MCLILFAYKQHPDYRLVLAANRDEFYARPTTAARWWPEVPSLLAGRDERNGGSWLGVDRRGRFASVTNIRNPADHAPGRPSRGALIRQFLAGKESAATFLEAQQAQAESFPGYNLLLDDGDELWASHNRGGGNRLLVPGLYGLSNARLDTPWPKVVRGKERLAALLHRSLTLEGLFALLADTSTPNDEDLPATGVGLEWERYLASAFIMAPGYGTRSSAVLLIGYDGVVQFSERTYAHNPRRYRQQSFYFRARRGA